MNPKNIGIASILDRERAIPVLNKIIKWLSKRHVTIYVDNDTAKLFPSETDFYFSCCLMKELSHLTEIIIIMGGDGTLLRVARHIGNANVPILGINLGSLGFLTDVKADEAITALEEIFDGRYFIDKRMMLHATVSNPGSQKKEFSFALNDIVINKSPQSKLIKLETSVDGRWINTFLSDGLIISTPTGSTAYSLSAGGPIIHPGLHAILITPICPHILTNRPIVIHDKEKIKVIFEEKGKKNDEGCLLSADGQVFTRLKPGGTLEVRKASHTIKLIQAEGMDYYHVLRTKLKWGERGQNL